MARFHMDYETYCDLDLTKVGVDLYTAHPSCEVLMCSYALGDAPVKIWDALADPEPPRDLVEAILDDSIEKWAFNASFERLVTWRVLRVNGKKGLKTKYSVWKCAMVLAYMQSFIGGLEQIGKLVGIPEHLQKDANGKKLMKIFSMPNKPTKNQPHVRRNNITDPWEWEEYKDYCVLDSTAEREEVNRLIKYPILDEEWRYYWLDQLINDRGLPINRQFCVNGIVMAERRKRELTDELRELTDLPNPNSPVQLTAWLRDRGYPFNDIGKDTVKKVLAENEACIKGDAPLPAFLVGRHLYETGGFISDECVRALKLRQQVARTSVKKFDAIMVRLAQDDRIRHVFQFAGASRTNRAAGRAMQPHNLSRTPKFLEPEDVYPTRLEDVTEIITQGDYEMLALYCKEPMDALAGTVRSSIQAGEDEELVVCDLSSIETVVIGGVTGCERILNVFRDGRDAYKDFATELYGVPYAEVTKKQRGDAKPATLGAGFGLGGGDLIDGKRTGLWGYAEGMGIDISREIAHKAIEKYRLAYPEVQQTGYAFEAAIADTVRTGRRNKVGVVEFDLMKPYLRIKLPSGRYMYYHKPQVHVEERISRKGNPYKKEVVSYMGKQQSGQAWVRIYTHGGKWIENIVQAIARDILYRGMWLAHKAGFTLVGHVHDELISLERKGSNEFTWERLRDIMASPIPWFPGLPLGAAGYKASFYRKD